MKSWWAAARILTLKRDVSCRVFYGIFSVCLLLDTSNTAIGHTPPRTDISALIIYLAGDGCKWEPPYKDYFLATKDTTLVISSQMPCSLGISYCWFCVVDFKTVHPAKVWARSICNSSVERLTSN